MGPTRRAVDELRKGIGRALGGAQLDEIEERLSDDPFVAVQQRLDRGVMRFGMELDAFWKATGLLADAIDSHPSADAR